MTWQGEGQLKLAVLMHEIVFVNFWVIILFLVFGTSKPKKTQKPKKPKNLKLFPKT